MHRVSIFKSYIRVQMAGSNHERSVLGKFKMAATQQENNYKNRPRSAEATLILIRLVVGWSPISNNHMKRTTSITTFAAITTVYLIYYKNNRKLSVQNTLVNRNAAVDSCTRTTSTTAFTAITTPISNKHMKNKVNRRRRFHLFTPQNTTSRGRGFVHDIHHRLHRHIY